MSLSKGRFLQLTGDRIIFADSANRDRTLSSKLTVGKKMVGKQEVQNLRLSLKIVNERVPVVIPGCDDACLRGTEQLVTEIGFSGSAYSKVALRQSVIDACNNVLTNVDDYLAGWNLTSASDVNFNTTMPQG